MAPEHNEIVRKEVDVILRAAVTYAASARSFPVDIAQKKEVLPRYSVDRWTLTREMKVDRWPLPKIEEIFDEPKGCSVFSPLDLLVG